MIGLLLAVTLVQHVEHPVQRYRIVPDAPVSRVDLRARPSDDPLPAPLAALTEREPSSIVGGWARPGCETFGDLTAVAMGPSGRLFVLDRDSMVVHVVAGGASCPRRFGRRGEGPGRFLSPRALDVDARGAVHVLDLDGSIEVFSALEHGLLYESERSVETGINASSFCVTDDGWVVHGYRRDGGPGLIHEVARDGTISNSFGRLYADPSTRTSFLVVQGRILCPAGDRVVHVPATVLGEVRAFSRVRADVLWMTLVEDFEPPRVTTDDDRLSVSMPDGGYDRVVSFTAVPGDGLLLQIGHRVIAEGRTFPEPDDVLSLWIDEETGRARPLGRRLPLVLAWGPGVAITSYDSFQRSLAVVPVR